MFERLKNSAKSFFKDDINFKQNTLGEPTPLVALLPWRCYDESEGIYINDNSIGCFIEFNPLSGYIGETEEEQLSKLFGNGLADKMTVQFYRWENPHSGYWLEKMKLANANSDNKTIAKIYQSRYEHLKNSNKKSLFDDIPFYMRTTNCYIAISMQFDSNNSTKVIGKIKKAKNQFIKSFRALSGFAISHKPENFMAIVEQWLHPNFDLLRTHKKYDELIPIDQQIYNGNHQADIFANGMLLDDICVVPLTVKQLPDNWSSHLTPSLNGAEDNLYSRFICPTLTVMNFTAMDAKKAKFLANTRRMELDRQTKDPITVKLIPGLKKEQQDWLYVSDCLADDDKLVKSCQYVIAFDTADSIEESLATLISIYGEKGWTLQQEKYGNFPSFLYSLPFLPSEKMYEDFLEMGRLRTRLSSTCASLTNFYASSKGNTADIGILLQGRHGQPFYWNPFVSETNYNTSIVGVPGAGKSALMQEIVSFILSCNNGMGQCLVIDDGYSFQNSCKLLGGEHIVMKNDVCINPFSMIDETTASTDIEYLRDGLILVDNMIEVMCRPRSEVTESESQRIGSAVRAAWKHKKSKATITDVANEIKQNKHHSGGVDEVSQELFNLLKPFCKGGQSEQLFNSKHTLNIRNKYTVYEMSILDKDKTLQSLVLMMIFFMVSEKMYHGDRNIPKGIVIDEAWNLLKGAGTAKFIEGIARRTRKYNAALVVGTQSLEDFATGAAKAAWDSSNWRILMQQSESAIKSANDNKIISLNEYSMKQAISVSTVSGKYSEMLIMQSNNSFGIIGRLPLDPYSVAIYSSKAADVTAIQRLQEQQGVDLATAVEIYANRKKG